jgi:hypothetical protein
MWGGSAWRYNQPINKYYLISVLENLCVLNIAHCQTLWPLPTLSPPPLLLSNVLSLWHHTSSYCLIQHTPQHVFTCNKQHNKMWPLSHIHSSIQVSKGYKTICYETHIGNMICKLTNHKSLHNLRHHFQHSCPCQKTRSCENQLKAPSAQKLQTRFLQCFGSIHKLRLCHERIILKLMLIIRLVLLLSQHHQWMASILSRKQNFTSPVSILKPI